MGWRATMFGVGSGLMMAGLAMILHAAFSIMKYRTELKALDMQFTYAPWNVIIECCIGMAFCVLGTASGAKLQPVFAKRECAERPYDKSIGAVSFMAFNHRGRGLVEWPTA